MDKLIFVRAPSCASREDIETLRDDLNRLPYTFVVMLDTYDVMSRDEIKEMMGNILQGIEDSVEAPFTF